MKRRTVAQLEHIVTTQAAIIRFQRQVIDELNTNPAIAAQYRRKPEETIQ